MEYDGRRAGLHSASSYTTAREYDHNRTLESAAIALSTTPTYSRIHIFTYSHIQIFPYSHIHIFPHSHITYLLTALSGLPTPVDAAKGTAA